MARKKVVSNAPRKGQKGFQRITEGAANVPQPVNAHKVPPTQPGGKVSRKANLQEQQETVQRALARAGRIGADPKVALAQRQAKMATQVESGLEGNRSARRHVENTFGRVNWGH